MSRRNCISDQAVSDAIMRRRMRGPLRLTLEDGVLKGSRQTEFAQQETRTHTHTRDETAFRRLNREVTQALRGYRRTLRISDMSLRCLQPDPRFESLSTDSVGANTVEQHRIAAKEEAAGKQTSEQELHNARPTCDQSPRIGHAACNWNLNQSLRNQSCRTGLGKSESLFFFSFFSGPNNASSTIFQSFQPHRDPGKETQLSEAPFQASRWSRRPHASSDMPREIEVDRHRNQNIGTASANWALAPFSLFSVVDRYLGQLPSRLCLKISANLADFSRFSCLHRSIGSLKPNHNQQRVPLVPQADANSHA